jgi:hypothetical protein
MSPEELRQDPLVRRYLQKYPMLPLREVLRILQEDLEYQANPNRPAYPVEGPVEVLQELLELRDALLAEKAWAEAAGKEFDVPIPSLEEVLEKVGERAYEAQRLLEQAVGKRGRGPATSATDRPKSRPAPPPRPSSS